MIAVVTGASAGVGRATVRALARRGASIALVARGIEGLEGAKRDVESLGGKALILPADVADAEQVERCAEAAEQDLGPIDIWINNAMVSVLSPVKEMKPEEYRRVTEVTYLGVVYGTLSALRRMLPRNRGVIVQVGSALAYRGIPLQSAYCGAKHAIQGFVDSLRCELLHDKSRVRVAMVQLPAMNTPQFSWVRSRMRRKPQPVPPIYQPELGAEAILFAALNNRREMYIGYPTVAAIVGDKFAGGLADRYLANTAYESQQTSEPAQEHRGDNLTEPLPGDWGAHGEFGDRAADRSLQLEANMRRGQIALGSSCLAGLVLGALLMRLKK